MDWATRIYFLLVCLGIYLPAIAVEFYVAPNGSDTNPGTIDQPFLTLERARDSLRKIKSSGPTSSEHYVYVRAGTYMMPQTLVLDEEDSGTEMGAILYRTYAGEKVVLVGGGSIQNFIPHTEFIYKTKVNPTDFNGIPFRIVVFDEVRQVLARYPNSNPTDLSGGDWAYVTGKRYSMYSDSPGFDEYHAQNKHLDFWQRNVPLLTRTLELNPEDARAWKHPEQGEVSIFPRFNWSHYVLPIISYDPTLRTLYLAEGSFYEIRPGDRYFLQGLFEELDHPGEWYLDPTTWELYFWPPKSIDNLSVYASSIEHIMLLRNCTHVRFEGFVFECSSGTPIVFKDCSHCSVTQCTIRNSGGYDSSGISIEGGKANSIVDCHIYAIGGNGLYVKGGNKITLDPGGHTVEHSTIHHVGLVGRHGKGIQLEGSGNRVAHCLIHHVPHSAVFMWGNNHVIEFNKFHHTCLETEDAGAIGGGAIDWLSWHGVLIRHNFISDTIGFGYDVHRERWCSPYFTYAVYPDWAASGVTILGNILVRAGSGGIMLHGGRNNIVENNIIVDNPISQLYCTGWTTTTGFWSTKQKAWSSAYKAAVNYDGWKAMPAFVDPHRVPLASGHVTYGNTIQRNIFCYKGHYASLWQFTNTLPQDHKSDYNLVWHYGAPIKTGSMIVSSEIGENLLSNPDIENGVQGQYPTEWYGPSCSDSAAKIYITTESAYSGVQALKIEPPPILEDELPRKVYFTFAYFLFKPGQTYCLRAWMKPLNESATAELSVFSWEKDVHSWTKEQNFLLTENWKEYSLVFRLPALNDPEYKATMATFGVRLNFSTGGLNFFVDSLRLHEVTVVDEWESWRVATGNDHSSIVADPLFVDETTDDYRLKPESPAFTLGFTAIPIEKIGPQTSMK